MAVRCAKHQFENASDICRSCREAFCAQCLVWSHGPKKPPYCIPCALNAAGVRSGRAGARPRP